MVSPRSVPYTYATDGEMDGSAADADAIDEAARDGDLAPSPPYIPTPPVQPSPRSVVALHSPPPSSSAGVPASRSSLSSSMPLAQPIIIGAPSPSPSSPTPTVPQSHHSQQAQHSHSHTAASSHPPHTHSPTLPASSSFLSTTTHALQQSFASLVSALGTPSAPHDTHSPSATSATSSHTATNADITAAAAAASSSAAATSAPPHEPARNGTRPPNRSSSQLLAASYSSFASLWSPSPSASPPAPPAAAALSDVPEIATPTPLASKPRTKSSPTPSIFSQPAAAAATGTTTTTSLPARGSIVELTASPTIKAAPTHSPPSTSVDFASVLSSAFSPILSTFVTTRSRAPSTSSDAPTVARGASAGTNATAAVTSAVSSGSGTNATDQSNLVDEYFSVEVDSPPIDVPLATASAPTLRKLSAPLQSSSLSSSSSSAASTTTILGGASRSDPTTAKSTNGAALSGHSTTTHVHNPSTPASAPAAAASSTTTTSTTTTASISTTGSSPRSASSSSSSSSSPRAGSPPSSSSSRKQPATFFSSLLSHASRLHPKALLHSAMHSTAFSSAPQAASSSSSSTSSSSTSSSSSSRSRSSRSNSPTESPLVFDHSDLEEHVDEQSLLVDGQYDVTTLDLSVEQARNYRFVATKTAAERNAWFAAYSPAIERQTVTWTHLRWQELSDTDIKRLARKGIPAALRPRVWAHAMRLSERKARQPGRFAHLLEHGVVSPDAKKMIEKDLDRTFVHHPAFHLSPMLSRLRHVLLAFAAERPDVGYCQSLNFLAGFFLLLFTEEDAFWMMVAVIGPIVPTDYFTERMVGIYTDLNVLLRLVETRLPRLYRHLKACGVDLRPICFPWLLSVFIKSFPVETAMRVWDSLLFEGSKVLFRVALALLMRHEEQICRVNDFGLLFNGISLLGVREFDCETLMSMGFGVRRLSRSTITKLRRVESEAIEEEFRSLHAASPEDEVAGAAVVAAKDKDEAAAVTAGAEAAETKDGDVAEEQEDERTSGATVEQDAAEQGANNKQAVPAVASEAAADRADDEDAHVATRAHGDDEQEEDIEDQLVDAASLALVEQHAQQQRESSSW